MDNKVENPKTEIPSTTEMTDKDYIQDMLDTEKCEVKNYAVALTEMSNDSLYKRVFKIFEDTSMAQRDVFNLIFKKGWYSLEKAEEQKINQKYTEYSAKVNELQ